MVTQTAVFTASSLSAMSGARTRPDTSRSENERYALSDGLTRGEFWYSRTGHAGSCSNAHSSPASGSLSRYRRETILLKHGTMVPPRNSKLLQHLGDRMTRCYLVWIRRPHSPAVCRHTKWTNKAGDARSPLLRCAEPHLTRAQPPLVTLYSVACLVDERIAVGFAIGRPQEKELVGNLAQMQI
jgi:hypothetical protein